MAERDRAWLIVNPNAGSKGGITTNPLGPEQAQAVLERHHTRVEVRPTERAGHATELAREAVRAGAELVVAAGGDGTVHEVACGLIGTQTTLGVLPLGSVMNIARALNIPRDLEQAAEVIRARRTVRMDVGKATTAKAEAYFLEAAGVGIDAGIFAYADQLDSGHWGSLFPLLRFLVRYRPGRVQLMVDGHAEQVLVFSITVAIGPFLGPAMAVAPGAKVDDRQFDVVVWERLSRLELLRHFGSIASGRRAYHPKARRLKGRTVQVEGVRRQFMVHADGHTLGPAPVRFELIPAALAVIVGEAPAGEPSAVVPPAEPVRR
jgi:YegS/Rv2252/BmrU family lipid kinase